MPRRAKTAENLNAKNTITLHGTLLKIHAQGVLIKGQSGSGKSLLALELIQRKHQFVADDAVQLEKKRQRIIGKCPPQIQDFMYIKEFGIINVRKMFGANAICMHTELNLVINLSSTKKIGQENVILSRKGYKTTKILGTNIPLLTIPGSSAPAILVETAARDLQLKAKGYFALEVFKQQHQQFIDSLTEKSYDR